MEGIHAYAMSGRSYSPAYSWVITMSVLKHGCEPCVPVWVFYVWVLSTAWEVKPVGEGICTYLWERSGTFHRNRIHCNWFFTCKARFVSKMSVSRWQAPCCFPSHSLGERSEQQNQRILLRGWEACGSFSCLPEWAYPASEEELFLFFSAFFSLLFSLFFFPFLFL